MKGWVPVEIPTKKYIKAYIISQLGEKPMMNTSHPIGKKLEDVLQHKANEYKNRFSSRYDCYVRIYISRRMFARRGAHLNETNIKNFNVFVELLIKHRFYQMMDDFNEVLSGFEVHLPEVRRRLCIDIESWSDDSMKKDYYRYRKSKGKPMLYRKIFAESVPSEKFVNAAF